MINSTMKDKVVYQVPVFPTPLLFSKFEKHDTYDFPDIPKVDRKPRGWILPLNTSFPGEGDTMYDDPYMPKELLSRLSDDILDHCKHMMGSLDAPTDISLKQFWYNAYYEGQGQEVHNHLAATNSNPFWSGIYFAQNCSPGQLQFTNMNNDMRSQQTWDHDSSKLKSYYRSIFNVASEDGAIMLFPPFLNHHVKVGIENRHKMRLTFSFNVTINEHLRNGQASI